LVLAACAQVSFLPPWSDEVPVTGQTFGVLFTAVLLGTPTPSQHPDDDDDDDYGDDYVLQARPSACWPRFCTWLRE
jgi:hypothetical protein